MQIHRNDNTSLFLPHQCQNHSAVLHKHSLANVYYKNPNYSINREPHEFIPQKYNYRINASDIWQEDDVNLLYWYIAGFMANYHYMRLFMWSFLFEKTVS